MDEFAFVSTPVCEFNPPEAKPNPTTTTTLSPTTTPEPTEPPTGKFCKTNYIHTITYV